MGSSGTGRISDYPGSSKPSKTKEDEDKKEPGHGGGSSKGSGGNPGGPDDRCAKAFSTQLEDVEHSEYFVAHGEAPPEGTAVILEHRKRLVAATELGKSIGSLPTSMNYLAGCMKAGWKYVGKVRKVTNDRGGIQIFADFAPSKS